MNKQFRSLLDRAVDEFREHGFRDMALVTVWLLLLSRQAKESFEPAKKTQDRIKKSLKQRFDSELKKIKNVPATKLDLVRPDLNSELNRRIKATEDIITANRETTVDTILRRFQGWATSVPDGGTDAGKLRETVNEIGKPLTKITGDERRVVLDQSNKLAENVKHIVAERSGAIAGLWHSNFREPGYNYREPHKRLDVSGKIFTLGGNWAEEEGLMKPGAAGYMEDIELPGQLPNCKCSYIYLYSLAELPHNMLTKKGIEYLKVKH